MAAKKTAEATEKKTRTRKPKSLKIVRKRKPKAKKTPRVKLTIKQAKLDRVIRKARTIVRRALKKAVRGMGLKRIPDKLYKKIDTAVAKNTDLTGIVEAAVVKAVNDLPALKSASAPAEKKTTKKRRTRKAKEVAAEPAPAATTNGKRGKKKEAEPAATAEA